MTVMRLTQSKNAHFALKKNGIFRIGVVDIGSNSVRLVIFDGAARSPAYFFNEKIMCGLGAGLAETGRLNPEGRARALAAIARFHALSLDVGVAPLKLIATAAMREAKDAAAFCDDVRSQTGLDIQIIDGPEEARFSAQGVLLGWPEAEGLVCDIGGASMELARIKHGEVRTRLTSDLGPLKLRDIKGGKAERRDHIRDIITQLHDQIGGRKERLYLVGGSWRAIARIDMARRNYPLKVLHEYRMTTADVRSTAALIENTELSSLAGFAGVSNSRIQLVPYATEVLRALIRRFNPKDIAISSYGLREGMLYEAMDETVRALDPLIEACRFAEEKDARNPGFGDELYSFILPIFRTLPTARLRIVKAACLLHDVSWRAHPDYRARVCFDNATRANLGGINHEERVYLGLALLHRYSNKRDKTDFDVLAPLLSQALEQEAEVLGKALRFGAMLSTQRGAAGSFRWRPKRRELILTLPKQSMVLFGEAAQSRLKALASALKAELSVETAP